MHKLALAIVIVAELGAVFTVIGLYWAGLLGSDLLPWLVFVIVLFTLLEVMLVWNSKGRVKKSVGRTVMEWAGAGLILGYVYFRHVA